MHGAGEQAVMTSGQRWGGPVACAAGIGVLSLGLSSVGLGAGVPALAGAAGFLSALILGGSLAGAYLLAGVGLGRLCAPLLRGSGSALWIQSVAGLGLLLFLSHLMGVLGLLSGGGAVVAAWVVVGLGLVLFADSLVRGALRPEGWPVLPVSAAVCVPGVAVLLVGAANPPGWLWESEAGGFDVLSYHLQLAREWAERGRVEPLGHNVYSFLPSYVESAFLHLGALSGNVRAPALVGGEGAAVFGAQYLHAGMGVLAALVVGRAACVLLLSRGVGRRAAATGGVLAGCAALCTPWVVVVGSMAYNELAVTALLGGAVLCAVDGGRSAVGRAVVCGALVGVACSAKPTALFLGAPVVGLLLLDGVERRRWVGAVCAGGAAGVLAMSPWLVRNWLASGNPVFPFASGIFGEGHWTREQHERYSAAHSFDGGVLDRIALLFSDDRGFLHAQWSVMPAAGVIGLALLCAWGATRRLGVLLSVGVVAQVACWMALTHLQSRFLVPLIVPLCVAFGAASGFLIGSGARGGRRAMGVAGVFVCVLVPLALGVWSVAGFLSQREGRPNALLAGGVAAMTGEADRAVVESAPPGRRGEILGAAPTPHLLINLGLGPGETVYLLGDSTPFYYTRRVLYHTTWDASPLGVAVRHYPDDPGEWTRMVRGLGARYVLVNFAELTRLSERDGWYDPAVTPGLVARWISEWGVPVREWRDQGRVLVELRGVETEAAPDR